MKKQIIKPGLYIMCSILLLFSCKKEEQSITPLTESLSIEGRAASEIFNVFKGPNVPIGNGYARSWIRINHQDMPLEIGIELTEAAVASLPERANLVLPLHHKAQEVTPFNHIGLDFNEHGHQPGFFSIPHFDTHFYMMTLEERLAIPEVTPLTLPFFNLAPPTGYMPITYSPGGPEPRMGQHWIPPPPTFLPFSRVMVYGTYNGEVKFLEPMITVAHMLSGGSTNNFLTPQKFAVAGNYPTIYSVYKDLRSGNYNITMSNFVARAAN